MRARVRGCDQSRSDIFDYGRTIADSLTGLFCHGREEIKLVGICLCRGMDWVHAHVRDDRGTSPWCVAAGRCREDMQSIGDKTTMGRSSTLAEHKTVLVSSGSDGDSYYMVSSGLELRRHGGIMAGWEWSAVQCRQCHLARQELRSVWPLRRPLRIVWHLEDPPSRVAPSQRSLFPTAAAVQRALRLHTQRWGKVHPRWRRGGPTQLTGSLAVT